MISQRFDENTRYISIEDFLKIAKVKEKTIKKNQHKIPGLSYENGSYTILEGTRYICSLHRYKMKNAEEKRYILLKMISEYKYISHIELRLYPKQFRNMLAELLSAKLIRPNGMANK